MTFGPCPAPSIHLSARPSVCPNVVTTLEPTMFNGFCSYSVQRMTLVGAWTPFISLFIFTNMRFLNPPLHLSRSLDNVHLLRTWKRENVDTIKRAIFNFTFSQTATQYWSFVRSQRNIIKAEILALFYFPSLTYEYIATVTVNIDNMKIVSSFKRKNRHGDVGLA